MSAAGENFTASLVNGVTVQGTQVLASTGTRRR